MSNDLAESELVGRMLRELYARMTFKELMRELGCSYYTLRRAMWEYGIPVRKQGRYAMHQFKLTQGLYDAICRDGIQSVAQRIGMSYLQLSRHVKNDPRVQEWSRRSQSTI